MNWLEIVGAIGGGAGLVALIKVGIDVYNARSMTIETIGVRSGPIS